MVLKLLFLNVYKPCETPLKMVCLLSEGIAILREFGEDYEWFLESRSKLLSKYANKWVAIHKKEILDFDNELTPLLKRLRNKGLKPEHLLIQFLSKEPIEAILCA